MSPTAWARAIHVRLDVRGMLRDLADIADAAGNFEIKLGELMGLSSTGERSIQRMLAYLETIGAIKRDSQPGRSGFVRARLCLEVDPSDIQHIVNVAAPAIAAAKGASNDTISSERAPGNGAISDTFTTPAPTRAVEQTPLRGGVVTPNGVAAAAAHGSNGQIAKPRKKPRPPSLIGPPTLTPAEQQQLVVDFLPRFQELRLGTAAITKALSMWEVSDKALRFPRQFPAAKTWVISATDWLEHDLRYLAEHQPDRPTPNGVPPARGRPVPAGRSDYGFSEGRVIGDR